MNYKRRLIRAACILAAAAVMSASFAGCAGKNGGESGGNGGSSASDSAGTAENLIKINYKIEDIPLPKEITYVSQFSWDGEKIHIVYNDYSYDEKTQTSSETDYLYCLDMQGNIISKQDITPEKMTDGDSVYMNVTFAADGTLWLMEVHNVPVASSSDTETESTEETAAAEADIAVTETAVDADFAVDYEEGGYIETETVNIIRHIDTEGKELYKQDISQIAAVKDIMSEDNTYINSFVGDGEGRLTLVANRYSDGGSAIIILGIDENGELTVNQKFDEGDSWFNGCFTGGDGKQYIMIYMREAENGRMTRKLFTVDFSEKKLTEGPEIPEVNGQLLSGNSDYLAFSSESSSIFGIKPDGTKEEFFNCVNNGIDDNYVSTLAVHGEEMLIAGNNYGMNGDDSGVVLHYVKKLPVSEAKEKIEVRLAAYYLDENIRTAVARYNKSDGDYVITVTDYSQFNDYSSEDQEAWNAGRTKLNAEIAAGNIPDIIAVGDIETSESLSSKGLFVDLNEFIDGENGINRADYLDNVFRGMERNGKLYSISSGVYLVGMCAKKSIIPNDGPISWEEVESAVSANDGMQLFTMDMTRENFLMYAMMLSGNKYINSNTNECNFNCPEFVKALEISKDFPEEIDYSSFDESYWQEYDMQFRNNKTLFNTMSISEYGAYNQLADGTFGEDISVVGFPGTDSGMILMSQGSISVSAKSAHPEAGWQLIKSTLEYDENVNYRYMWRFPVNRQALKKMGEQTLESNYYTDENGNKVENENYYYINGGDQIKIKNPDQALIDKVNGILENATIVLSYGVNDDIMNILKEEASSYYGGTATAQQAADNIQSRVSLYVSEHS